MSNQTTVRIEMLKSEYTALKNCLEWLTDSLEHDLGNAIASDNSPLIGDATARLRIADLARKGLKISEH